MKNQLFFFNLVPFWIIVLMPILLISGPFLSDLGISLIAILFLINSVKNNLTKYYNNYYFKFYIVFCLILILSSLMSDNTLISLKNSLFYFRFGIFSLCFWYLLDKNELLIKYLFFSMLICFLSLVVDGYIQYIFGKNLIGYDLFNEYRVSSFFGSELILGSYIARFFPILFGLFIYLDKIKKNKRMLFLVSLVFILSEGLIVLSGERLALFFMNLSAVYIILMLKEYRVYRLSTYLLSLCLIFVMLNLFPNTKERLIDQTIKGFTFSQKNENNENKFIFSEPHTDMYTSAYRMFLDNKFFGVGPRQYRNQCDKYKVSEYSCETHPHNTYLELLSEAGLFAFLMVMLAFIGVCYLSTKHFLFKFYKNKKNILNDFQVCLLSSILISLWPFAPSGSFFNNWMSIVYYFPVGLFLWQKSKYTKIEKKTD